LIVPTHAAADTCRVFLQVNFDPERFVEYITKADDYLQLIRNKLAQAGVQGRPTAAQLPWFDLQVSSHLSAAAPPLCFCFLSKA
jgi:hypothetical protein